MTALTFGQIQRRALIDAEIAWREAQAALDNAQRHAEHLHNAAPQLLTDDLFYEALGAIGGMGQMLDDLIAAVTE